jgi:hypothetical protein
MDKKGIDYYITSTQLIPPIAGNRYAAKLAWMKQRTPKGVKDVRAPKSEYHGVTAAEAEAKARAAIEEWLKAWIAKQSDRPTTT